MMTNISRLERRTEYFLLLLTYGLLILPPITCQSCNSQNGEPMIEISSTPSSNTFPINATVNLTCKAWQTDDDDPKTRPFKIYWYGPQGKRVGKGCEAASLAVKEMSCPLMVGPLTKDKFGVYMCKAINPQYRCSIKIFEIRLLDKQMPEIDEVPVNQTAAIGSMVTFNCTVTGHPKPAITWTKDNDSHSVQFNPRAKVITDDDKSHSQLIITGVTSEDYGTYQCVGNNSAGVKIYSVAFLNPGAVEIQKPEIVEVPVNQTAAIGSMVTFNCTVTGHPKPVITWTKDNDSHSVQSNPRAKVITDDDKSHSQLVITGVTSEDYGTYQCVGNNSAGVKISSMAFLFQVSGVPNPLRTATPQTARQSASLNIVSIAVPSVIVTMLIIMSVFLWYRRRYVPLNKACDIPGTIYTRFPQEETDAVK